MNVDATVYCQANKCMAWRWKFKRNPSYESTKEQVEYGYCGLAGEPLIFRKNEKECHYVSFSNPKFAEETGCIVHNENDCPKKK